MTGFQPPIITSYTCIENGLSFTVNIYQLPSGKFEAAITVLEGHADFNAIYFGDEVDDGSSFAFGGKDQNLNMNGRDLDHDGNAVDWDGGIKLSSPGLGRSGVSKETYLTSGETMTVSLPSITSFDQLQNIGIRATSTSTPEGSIKCVLNQDDDESGEPDPEVAAAETDTNPSLATIQLPPASADLQSDMPAPISVVDPVNDPAEAMQDAPIVEVKDSITSSESGPAEEENLGSEENDGPSGEIVGEPDTHLGTSDDTSNLYLEIATLPDLDQEYLSEEDEEQPEEMLIF